MPNLAHVNWEEFLIHVIVVVLSLSLHEFGHAISADRLGDPGPRRAGRITLWPDRHLDPIGFIMILITSLGVNAIGWGKPVMVNPRFFKHPRRDMMIVAACGPLMNLLLAIAFGLVLRIVVTIHPDSAYEWVTESVSGRFVWAFVTLNLLLMCFNLIPMHPLDGGKLLSNVLPFQQSVRFDRFFYQFGPMILLFVIFSGSGVLGTIIGPPVDALLRLIVGRI
jgi:Zn-dependent protease